MPKRRQAIVGITEARTRFSQLTDEINTTGQSVLVLKNNKPWVKIMPAGVKPETKKTL